MIHPRFGFVVEYVKDIEASKRFYVDVLGLKVQREHPTFVQFESVAIASTEPLGGGEAELCWLVDDAEAAQRELSGKTRITKPIEQKPFGKVFAVEDPDRRSRFIVQLAADRPSKAV